MTSHDPITPKARELFERASERVDQGTAFRLQRARISAQQPRPSRPATFLVPAGAFAAAALALGIAWWSPTPPTVPDTLEVSGIPTEAEVDLLVDEDPELYAWLAEAPVAVLSTGPRL
jgi:hypothetical protein